MIPNRVCEVVVNGLHAGYVCLDDAETRVFIRFSEFALPSPQVLRDLAETLIALADEAERRTHGH